MSLNRLQGEYIEDPWRRSLGAAIQWHDTLQVEVQKRLDAVLDEQAASLKALKASSAEPNTAESPSSAEPNTAESASSTEPNTAESAFSAEPNAVESASSAEPNAAESASSAEQNTAECEGESVGEASRRLQGLCPACFAGRTWGRSFNE